MSTLHGASKELQALEDQVQNRTDWKYEMRRDAQEILPGSLVVPSPGDLPRPAEPADSMLTNLSTVAGLYVGPFQPSWKREVLQGLGITHILCIAETRESCVTVVAVILYRQLTRTSPAATFSSPNSPTSLCT